MLKYHPLIIRMPLEDAGSAGDSQFNASRRILDELTAHYGLSANKVAQRALRVLHQQIFPEQYTAAHKAESSVIGEKKKITLAKKA